MYTGKCGIGLSRSRRLKVALGAATRGLAYLHEHADPPIYRDINQTIY